MYDFEPQKVEEGISKRFAITKALLPSHDLWFVFFDWITEMPFQYQKSSPDFEWPVMEELFPFAFHPLAKLSVQQRNEILSERYIAAICRQVLLMVPTLSIIEPSPLRSTSQKERSTKL